MYKVVQTHIKCIYPCYIYGCACKHSTDPPPPSVQCLPFASRCTQIPIFSLCMSSVLHHTAAGWNAETSLCASLTSTGVQNWDMGWGEKVKTIREERWKRGLSTRIFPPPSFPNSCWETYKLQSHMYWLSGWLFTAAAPCNGCPAGSHSWWLFPSAWGVMGRRAASMQRAWQQATVAYS